MEALTRGRWIWDKVLGRFVDYIESRIDVDAPTIITDETGPTYCHADGKIYTSRRKMMRAVKASGFEMTEGVSNTASNKTELKEEDIAKDIEAAYYEVRDGMAPLTEEDKERCKRINNQLESVYGIRTTEKPG